MLNIIKSNERHHANFGWLDTHWHFSFADYFDPNNMNFGPLRVFNDDIVAPESGFDLHPHRDMEIVTYVLSGELTHEDSQGNRGILRPGELQVMSAGKGIYHSEFNKGKEEPVHLLQLWIQPRRKGSPPRWVQRAFPATDRSNRLLPVVSSGDIPDTMPIDQDAAIYISRLESGSSVTHTTKPDRRTYLFVATGRAKVNGQVMDAGDQARIENEPKLDITAEQDSELILLDLP